MIEIEKNQADVLYSKVKNMILEKKSLPGYNYEKKQHHLYEEDASKEVREKFYNESGSLEILTESGETVVIEINRWHVHQHNGWSGLNGNPCLSTIIYIKKDNEKKILWELKVGSGTMHYEAWATNIEIPLIEYETIDEDVKFQKIKIGHKKN